MKTKTPVFVKVCLSGRDKNNNEWHKDLQVTKQTQLVNNNNMSYYIPKFDKETFAYDVWAPNSFLKIEVYNYQNSGTKLGDTLIELRSLMHQKKHTEWLQLSENNRIQMTLQHTFIQPAEFLSHFNDICGVNTEQQDAEFSISQLYNNFWELLDVIYHPINVVLLYTNEVLTWSDTTRSGMYLVLAILLSCNASWILFLAHVVLLSYVFIKNKYDSNVPLSSSYYPMLPESMVLNGMSNMTFNSDTIKTLGDIQNQMARLKCWINEKSESLDASTSYGKATIASVVLSTVCHGLFSNATMLCMWVLYTFLYRTVFYARVVRNAIGLYDGVESLLHQHVLLSQSSKDPPPTHSEYTSRGWQKKRLMD